MKKWGALVLISILVFVLAVSSVNAKWKCEDVCTEIYCSSPEVCTCSAQEEVCYDTASPWFGPGDEGYKSEPRMPGGLGASSVNAFNGNLMLSQPLLSLPGRGMDVSLTARYNSHIYTLSDGQNPKAHMLQPTWLGYGWNMHMGKITVPHPECNGALTPNYAVEFSDGSTYPFLEADPVKYGGSEIHPEYILPNFGKIKVYNDIIHRYPDETPPLTDVPIITQAFVITDKDGTRYTFNHWVPLGTPNPNNPSFPTLPFPCTPTDPITGQNVPWSDVDPQGRDYFHEQHLYAGKIYLTEIKDLSGNYITVEYYNQQWRNDPSLDFPVSWGSPYISKITTSRGQEINFVIDNPSSIFGKLQEINYEGVNGPIKIDFKYSGEVTPNPYDDQCKCNLASGVAREICLDVCHEDALLVEVGMYNEDHELLYPVTKFTYNPAYPFTQKAFKLKRMESPDKGTLDYHYKDIFVTSGDGYYTNLNVLTHYILKPTPTDPNPLRYDYRYRTEPGASEWIRETAFIGPENDQGIRTITVSEFISDYSPTGANYYALNSWRAGNTIRATTYGMYDYDETWNEEDFWFAIDTWDLNDLPIYQEAESFYEPMYIGKKAFMMYNDLGYLDETWGNYYLPLKHATLTTSYGEDFTAKRYLSVVEEYDKFGNPKVVKNYGEITSAQKTYTGNGCSGTEVGMTCNMKGEITINDAANPYDDLLTEIEYLHEQNLVYADPIYNEFQIIGKVAHEVVKDPDTNEILSEKIYYYDLPGRIRYRYTPFVPDSLDNFEHHQQYAHPLGPSSILFGDLHKVATWESYEDKYLTQEFWYDEAGNLVRTEDPKGNEAWTYFTDVTDPNPYYENLLPPCPDFFPSSETGSSEDRPPLGNYPCDDGTQTYPGGSNDPLYQHAFPTKTVTSTGDLSLTTIREYYPATGALKKEYSYNSLLPDRKIGTMHLYDDLGRETETYALSDPVGSPTKMMRYDDFSTLRTATTYTKKDNDKILLVDFEYDQVGRTIGLNTDIIKHVLHDLGIPYDIEVVHSPPRLPDNMLDYDFIIISTGYSMMQDASDITRLEALLDNGKNVWIVGSDFARSISDVQGSNAFMNQYFGTSLAVIEDFNHFVTIKGLREFKEIEIDEFEMFVGGLPFDFADPTNSKVVLEARVYHPAGKIVEIDGIPTRIYEWEHNLGIMHDSNYRALITNFEPRLIGGTDREEWIRQVLPAFRFGKYYNKITVTFDRLGRDISTEQKDTDGQTIKTVTTYDEETGRKAKTSRPFKPGTPILETEYQEYDALGRIKELKLPNIVTPIRTNYGANSVEVENPNAVKVKTETDAYGRTIKTIEAVGITGEQSVTINEYNKLGNLELVRNPELQEFTYIYNSLGWMLNSETPDTVGAFVSLYDDNGNVIQKTDPQGNQVNFEYDKLNRVTKITGSKGADILYTYDYGDFQYNRGGYPTGKVVKIKDESGTRHFIYDEDGLLEEEVFIPTCVCTSGCPDLDGSGVVDGDDEALKFEPYIWYNDFDGNGDLDQKDLRCFTALYNSYYDQKIQCGSTRPHCRQAEMSATYAYDEAGNLVEFVDFNGHVHAYVYDDLGRVSRVTFDGIDVTKNYVYNPTGSIKEFKFGNEIKTTYQHEFRDVDLITGITTSKSGITYFDRTYEYDKLGNLRYETLPQEGKTLEYQYDNLNRLKDVIDDDFFGGDIGYTYDLTGNRETKTQAGVTESYFYQPGTNKLTTVTGSDDDATYTYDDNGNIVTKTKDGLTTSYEYDHNNMLRKVTFSDGGCAKYYYNADGIRYRKEYRSGNDPEKSGLITTYYYANGNLIYEVTEYGAVSCDPICGDFLLEGDEVCEYDNVRGLDCTDFIDTYGHTYEYGTLKCNLECDGYDKSSCGYCGDGKLQTAYEECDGNRIKNNRGQAKQVGYDSNSCYYYASYYTLGELDCNYCELDTSECNCYCTEFVCQDDCGSDGICTTPAECPPTKEILPIPRSDDSGDFGPIS